MHKAFLSRSGTSYNIEEGGCFIKELAYKSILPPQIVFIWMRSWVTLAPLLARRPGHLAAAGISPSRCNSCSGPRRFGSPGRACARCARRRGERCSCGSARWPPGRTGPRAWWRTDRQRRRTHVSHFSLNSALPFGFFMKHSRYLASFWRVCSANLPRAANNSHHL